MAAVYMERFKRRENVLLGYGTPQRLIGDHSSSPKPARGDSDVDFTDVFGGPPRRFSMQEFRYSFGETVDSNASLEDEEGDAVLSRSPWSGLEEMPVFGHEAVNHRRYPSDDFYDDIFRRDDSYSLPRRSDRVAPGSSPGSRVLSPARPLPPKADPFSSLFPSQFSLPAKLTRVDFPAFASGSQGSQSLKDATSNWVGPQDTPSSSLHRLSGDLQRQDELRNENRPSYRPSPLSHEFSVGREELPMTKSDEVDIDSNLQKDSKSVEAPTTNSLFHFSIYKWASKGAPLFVPLRGGANGSKSFRKYKTERSSSSSGRMQSNNMAIGLPTESQCDSNIKFPEISISTENEFSNTSGWKQGKNSSEKIIEDNGKSSHIIEDAVTSMPMSKFMQNSQSVTNAVPGETIWNHRREEGKPDSRSGSGLNGSTEKTSTASMQEAPRPSQPDLKPLHSLLHDREEEQGSDKATGKSEGKNSTMKMSPVSRSGISKNKKKNDRERAKFTKTEVTQPTEPGSGDSCKNSADYLGGNAVKGKVKDFVKIFSQEDSAKPQNDIQTRSQSLRWKHVQNSEADKVAKVITDKPDVKMHWASVNNTKILPESSNMENKNFEESENQKTRLKNTALKMSENSFAWRDATVSDSGLLPDGSKITLENLDDIFEENFQVKELSNDLEKLLGSTDKHEANQVLDSKIRQWSKGKEGNIRSLLSTLQFVLWPNSGWKPVALVDIIDGSSVKRAYQKALLYLHPDKLQQKGAAPHQKYIAAKVFDILQEAWDHFSTLGPF